MRENCRRRSAGELPAGSCRGRDEPSASRRLQAGWSLRDGGAAPLWAARQFGWKARAASSAEDQRGSCGRPAFTHAVSQKEPTRSEEHTSELQSPCNLVCRLLLEKINMTLAVKANAVDVLLQQHSRAARMGQRFAYRVRVRLLLWDCRDDLLARDVHRHSAQRPRQ